MTIENHPSSDIIQSAQNRVMSERGSYSFSASEKLPPIMEANLNYLGSLNRHVTIKQLQRLIEENEIYQNSLILSLQPPLTGGNRLQMDPRLGTPWTRNGAGAARMGMPLSNRQVITISKFIVQFVSL